MRKGLVFVSLVLVGGILSGCSLFSPVENPPVRTYTFETLNFSTARWHKGEKVLMLSAMAASPGYDSSDMIYSKNHFLLQSYANNRWIAAPAQLLTPLLQQSLQKSGCFKDVISSPSTANGDLTLDTQLLLLRQEFLADDGSRVRLAIGVTLIDNNSHEVLAHRDFTTIVHTSQSNPASGVVAANQAARIILNRISGYVCHSQPRSQRGGG